MSVVQPSSVRLSLSLDEAAGTLGVSRDSFERYVLPELRIVRVGRRVLVPLKELERYLSLHASQLLEVER